MLLLALARWDDGYGPGKGDYAQYLLHAEALAQGRAYDDTGYVYTERNPVIGPRTYSPGLPLTLAPFLVGGRDGLPAARAFLLAVGLAFALVAGLHVATVTGSTAVGATVTLLTGLSLDLARGTTQFMSDVPFAACVWGTIALAQRGAARVGPALGAAALGVVALLYRTAGAALILAGVAFALFRRDGGRLLAALPVVAWAATLVALSLLLPTGAGYVVQMPKDVGSAVAALGDSFVGYRYALGDALLAPFPFERANLVWHVAGLSLALVGAFLWWRRGWRTFLSFFVVAYAGVLLVFPEKVSRYAWPLFPFVLMAFCVGLSRLVDRLARASPEGVSPGRRTVVAVAVVLALAHGTLAAATPRVADLWDHADARGLAEHVEASHRRSPMRVVFFNPRALTWRTGAPSMGTFAATPDEWARELDAKSITHVVLGDLGAAPSGDRSLRALVAARPAAFEREHANASFEVLRVRLDGRSPR
jgi:hypothetical protein